MTDTTALEIGRNALTLAAMICAPLLGFGLVVGLVVSIFQAATQIHEMTLTFIPKMVAVIASIALFGPWMLNQLVTYSSNLIQDIPHLVK